MKGTSYCPHCRQPMVGVRLSVRLPLIKAEIFDVIEKAGAGGVTSRVIRAAVYGDRPISLITVRMHVQQINDLLLATGWNIRTADRRHWVLHGPQRPHQTISDVAAPQPQG